MDAELPDEVRQACASFLHAVNTSAEGLVDGFYLRGPLAHGEVVAGADVDFTAVLSHRPGPHDLQALEAAHTQVWFEFPGRELEGHHVVLDDLQHSPALCPPVPVAHHGSFVVEGSLDVDPVAWAELATVGVRLQGRDPRVLGIHHDPGELRAHAAGALAGEWARVARELSLAWPVAGHKEELVTTLTLGPARWHQLVATGALTGPGGAGRYVLEQLDERWHPLAREALRLREQRDEPRHIRSSAQRGKDLRDFVAWCVADGARLAGQG